MSAMPPIYLRYAALHVAVAMMLALPASPAHAADDARNPQTTTPSQTTDTSGKPKPSGSPLLLTPGKHAALTCDTEAFGMDFKPFKKTIGTIELKLVPQMTPPKSPADVQGTWYVTASAPGHVASIATLLSETCAKGCPFTRAPDGLTLLWAPTPKTLDKIGDTETLTIAALKQQPLSVSISTFRGRDIVALEKGACKSAEDEPLPDQSPRK